MNISKRKQGILAIICTIAMIVTSITVYNPREVKADPSATVDGKQYSATVKDSGEWTGFACQGIFGSARIHFAWGIAVDAATITASLNGNQLKVAGQNANGMYIPLTEVTNLEVGSYDIVVTATTVATKTAEAKEVSATATLKIEKVEGTTTGSSTKPLDPSDIKDSEWTLASGSKTVSYYIADGKADKVQVKPQLEGDNYYIAFSLAAKFKSVTFDGVSKDVEEGAFCRVKVSDLTGGYHTLVVTDYYGKESVTIYFKVAEEEGTTKYTVSIDGTEKQYEEGATITVPAEGQGYYDVTKKVAYAPRTELTVNENMTLKSIKLNVTMTPGASIRLAAPTGLRFQTTVKSGNEIAVDDILDLKTGTVTTGTLITTLDLYKANGKTLTKDSKYNFLDIANDGWFNDGTKTETRKFCGSIIKIQSGNYDREFIAVGYATINYSNGKSKTVYANVTENNAKSIQYVAKKVKASDKFSGYSSEQKAIIDKYIINGKEISE